MKRNVIDTYSNDVNIYIFNLRFSKFNLRLNYKQYKTMKLIWSFLIFSD